MNRGRLRKETVVRTNRAGGKRPNKQLSIQGAITGLPRRKGEYTRAADSIHQASQSVIKASPGFHKMQRRSWKSSRGLHNRFGVTNCPKLLFRNDLEIAPNEARGYSLTTHGCLHHCRAALLGCFIGFPPLLLMALNLCAILTNTDFCIHGLFFFHNENTPL